jgi:PAS domain S-box-containing protein
MAGEMGPPPGLGVFVASGAGPIVWANERLEGALRRAPERTASGLLDGGGEPWPPAGEERVLAARRGPPRLYTVLVLPGAGAGPEGPLGILIERAGPSEDPSRRERAIYLEQAVMDSADAFVSLDNEGRIRRWNDGARLTFGYEPGDVVGRAYDEVLVPPALREAGDLDRIEAVMAREGFVRGYETERLARDGRSIPVELTVTRLFDEAGRPAGRSVIYRDVSARRRLEAELRCTVDELKEANQNIRRNQERLLALEKLSAVGEMSARVAHEIRTPLVTIGGFAGALLRETPADAPSRRYLEIIREEVRRLEAIVSELLEYVRPPRIDVEPCDANEIVQSSLRPFEEEAASAGIDVRLRLDASLPPVPANRYQMLQVLSNLIQNAVQAMPRGGVLGLATEAGSNHVRITVADSGVGIPERHRRQIFKPFFTTKASGSGLGLAIAAQIVAQHSGTMSFESTEGRGTTFEIRLPLSREAA